SCAVALLVSHFFPTRRSSDLQGGLSLALSDEDLQDKIERLQWLSDEVGEPYTFDVLDQKELKRLIPAIGPTIPGATYTTMDGHRSEEHTSELQSRFDVVCRLL